MSIIYDQKYRYTSLHYLIKRFTAVSLLYKGYLGISSLKIKCDIHVKAASPWCMEYSGEWTPQHILREKTLLSPPCFESPLGISSEDQSPFIENGLKSWNKCASLFGFKTRISNLIIGPTLAQCHMEELICGQCYCLKHPCQGLLGTGEGYRRQDAVFNWVLSKYIHGILPEKYFL